MTREHIEREKYTTYTSPRTIIVKVLKKNVYANIIISVTK